MDKNSKQNSHIESLFLPTFCEWVFWLLQKHLKIILHLKVSRIKKARKKTHFEEIYMKKCKTAQTCVIYIPPIGLALFKTVDTGADRNCHFFGFLFQSSLVRSNPHKARLKQYQKT